MKTVKLTICNDVDVLDDMRVFSSIVRVAFNRYQDGLGEKETRAYCNARFDHNSWFIQSAIKEGAALYKLNGSKHILFGGKNNLRQYMRGLIDKDTFKYRRLFPIGIQGEKLHTGNLDGAVANHIRCAKDEKDTLADVDPDKKPDHDK